MILRLGVTGLPSKRQRRKATGLSFVEVAETFHQGVRPQTLAKWRADLPDDVGLVVRAHRDLTFPRKDAPGAGLLRDTEDVAAAWTHTLRAAKAARAAGVVLISPADFTPTDRHREALARAGARIAEELPGVRAIWEPRGLWGADTVTAVAAQAGFIPAFDPLGDEAPEDTDEAFFRLIGPGGVRSRYLEDDLLDVLEMAAQRSATWVGFDYDGALSDVPRLASLAHG